MIKSIWLSIALASAGVFLCPVAEAKTAILVNGLGMYIPPGPMGWIGYVLTQKGYDVHYLNHFQAMWIDRMPPVVACHSLGCNAVLDRADELPPDRRPKLIVTIDPGRFRSRAPKGVRVVNLYCPYHQIGGQRVIGAENVRVCGVLHSFMPGNTAIINRVVREIEKT